MGANLASKFNLQFIGIIGAKRTSKNDCEETTRQIQNEGHSNKQQAWTLQNIYV